MFAPLSFFLVSTAEITQFQVRFIKLYRCPGSCCCAKQALRQVVTNASVIRGNISPATTCGIQAHQVPKIGCLNGADNWGMPRRHNPLVNKGLGKPPCRFWSLCWNLTIVKRACKTGCLTVREGNGCPLMRVSASEMWCLILRCFWPKRTALLLQPARALQSVGEAVESRDWRQQNVQ